MPTKKRNYKGDHQDELHSKKKASSAAYPEISVVGEKERARLFLSLCSVYTQDSDDYVVAVAGPHHAMPQSWNRQLLSEEDLRYEFVRGYMQVHNARVADWPEASVKEQDPKRFKRLELCAAFGRVSWIWCQMLFESGDFEEAVKLTQRMSETLQRVAAMIADRAWELAEALKLTESVRELDEEAKAKFRLDTPIEGQVFQPRLHREFNELLKEKQEELFLVPCMQQEKYYAFFWTLSHVFSFQLTRSVSFSVGTNEVAIIPNGSKTPYFKMSEEEKAVSGSISLKEIQEALLEEGEELLAIVGALKASRGFALVAETLGKAVAKYKSL